MLSCSKICCPSFLSGALSIYKSKVIYEIDQPFDNEVECYYDDKYLGLILWSKNYKLVHIPLIAAYHLGSASYVGYSVLKFRNTKWFEGIVISEISLSKFSSRKSLQYQVILIFTIIAILLSILFLRNYFKSLLLAIKVADRIKENTKDKILIDSIPKLNAKLNIFIRRLHRGVQIER
jgi:GT2 family glycosyltransferase